MNSIVLIPLAAVGFIITAMILIKGRKILLGLIVGVMSIVLLVTGFNGYGEIKRDAHIFHPLAVQWLEDRDTDRQVIKTEEIRPLLRNYSIHCIYYSRDNLKAVVYVDLPSSRENLVMAFNRSNKRLDEVSFISKEKKPEPNMQNKLDPSIFFYNAPQSHQGGAFTGYEAR